MATLNDQFSQEMSEWERIKRAQRIRERNERKEQQAEGNHWNFLAGALVAKYLKADLGILALVDRNVQIGLKILGDKCTSQKVPVVLFCLLLLALIPLPDSPCSIEPLPITHAL